MVDRYQKSRFNFLLHAIQSESSNGFSKYTSFGSRNSRTFLAGFHRSEFWATAVVYPCVGRGRNDKLQIS
jgi:hypothetical protein